jgi:hypothetical protein
MKRIIKASILVLIGLWLITSTAVAQSPDGYELDWWTVDGGGAKLSDAGAILTLEGTVGQPDAGVLNHEDSISLAGGFWAGGEPQPGAGYSIYLPLILRK